MSFYAFAATMLVCIYLAVLAQNMEKGQAVWGCSVSLFAMLMIQFCILLIKRAVS